MDGLPQHPFLQRSPWRRSRTHPVNSRPDPRPLVPVAEVTKNKLSKFQYQKRQAEEVENDASKAAEADTADGTPSKTGTKAIDDKNGTAAAAATPANRLTWRDFMAPATSVEEDTNESPNERIMWDSKPDRLYGNAFSPVMARKGKGRKRARSSSPVSSPAGGATAALDKTPTVNVKKLAQALRSPHTDPTLELWDRYSLTKAEGHPAPVGLDNPALAQLVISSSPRPSKKDSMAAGDSRSNLRRAVSQGLHGNKKRKIEKTRSFSGSIDSQREMEAASKSSLVTQLLDSVNSSMQGSDASPEPKANPSEALVGSPSPKKRARESPVPAPKTFQANELSSDYGDDDFDDDTLMELEATINEPGQTQAPKVEANQDTPKARTATESFEGLDDDVFDGADALVTAAQQPRRSPRKAAPGPKATPVKPGAGEFDDDDEFGDLDDGDIDFDAVELAATQSLQQHTQASTSQAVRWSGNPI